jgi:Spy/CpxP family protein refolding chaperone
MHPRLALLAAFAIVATLPACSRDSATAPRAAQESLADLDVDLVREYGNTAAAAVDRAGIGGSEFPDSLRLSAEQKAKIQALHDAYRRANASDLAALQLIEQQLRAAITARRPRADILAILARAEPIRLRLAQSFAELQRAIFAVYTPAQQAWLTGRPTGPVACPRDVLSSLTTAQTRRIQVLRAGFAESVREHLETVRKVGEEVAAALRAGATRAEVTAILAKGEAAMVAIKAAEQRLAASIMELLTEEQRANACLVRALTGR